MRFDAAIQRQLRFPIRVEVLPGELFRSLIVRLAQAHGEKIQSLGFRLVGGGRQLFGDDVDRGRWIELNEALAMRTGLPVQTIIATTLKAYEGVLFGELVHNGSARWVLYIGQAGTHRRWSGLQYCSACLSDDKEPHFRLAWRLAFHVWCDHHRIRLRDRCSNCNGPVVIHRSGVGMPTSNRNSPLVFCPFCGHDRRADRQVSASPSDDAAVGLQLQMLRALSEGAAVVGERRAIHSLPYFTGMSMLWSFLDDHKRSAGVWTDVLRDVPALPLKPTGFRFGSIERLGIDERQVLLQACARLLKDGIPGLVETLCRAGLSSDKLLRYSGRARSQPPFWLWEPIRLGIDKTMYVPSTGEIDAAIDHLLRYTDDGYLRIRDVCAFIGMSTNHSARVATRMHLKGVVRQRRLSPASSPSKCHS